MTAISEVKSHIYAQVQNILLASGGGGGRSRTFHVTDYVQSCARKQYYSKVLGAAGEYYNYKDIAPLFTGSAIHKAMESNYDPKLTEIGMAIDVTTGEKVDPDTVKELPLEKRKNCIIGTLDALYMFDGTTAVVDYKTWHKGAYKKLKVDSVHEFQVQVYAAMYSICRGISPKYGAVVYLDTANRLEKPLVFPFKIKPHSDIMAKLVTRHAEFMSALETGKLPPRTDQTWLCEGYCGYASRCFSESSLPEKINKKALQ